MSKLLCLSDRDFNQTIQDIGPPFLVEFWASWCPPCKMAEPVLEELAQEEEKRVRIAKINVDQNPRTASIYKISGIPTFIIFNSGRVICRRTGVQSKQQLEEMLTEAGISPVS